MALALVIERFLSLREHLIAPAGLMQQAIDASQTALPSPEVAAQLSEHSTLGKVLASGWTALQADPYTNDIDLRNSLEVAGREAAHNLEKHLLILV